MMTQLTPPIPIRTPKGPALAHFVIDYGLEHDLFWVCFQDNTGECWTWNNKDIRAEKNITAGREHISPFYDPEDVALESPLLECIECGHTEWVQYRESCECRCARCGKVEPI